MNFAGQEALGAVERYECSHRQGETIVVETQGRKYRIAKHYPHAGGPLANSLIEATTATCLDHYHRFNLETGKCEIGNCTLFTRRIE